jgi:hypothetical protein
MTETCKHTFLRLLSSGLSSPDTGYNGHFPKREDYINVDLSFFRIVLDSDTSRSRRRPRGYVASPPETQRECTVATLGTQK